ncbi:glycosyltransferase [Bacillus sp. DX1.1]|uniref:CgeB family protein n=1 Tax=unclassified Bacillus (in: firmicutes) TaxID=185979 RepID=UPI00257041AA|nr:MULTISPECIES: glycosyltransferase [unclassified Bacillus (in: firmicutes)]MDM5157398.1 glycosyltransferase [Bacillus sp. DX1.1]WJE81622.1 glycosyltransferase [Bacillus sp. DX3.1]
MKNLLFHRMENIAKEKMYYKNRLKSFDTNMPSIDSITKTYQMVLKREYFKLNGQVDVENQERGITITSSLPEDRHEYIFCENKEFKSKLFQYFYKYQNKEMELFCSGFSSGKCSAEVHIIFLKADGKKIDQTKVNIGKRVCFTVPKLDKSDQLKIGIRLRRNGAVYLHNPFIWVREDNTRMNLDVPKRKLKNIRDLNVIFIADEFTTRSFEPEFNLIKVTPDNWEQELLEVEPDLFFCESAWFGNNGDWQNKVGTGGSRDNKILLQLLRWCKDREIPTIFWNKEDPFHYNAFINTAKHFDFVFTTDENSIRKYTSEGCKAVAALPFAAQPKYHNPVERFERRDKVVFAGAYYGDKFPERKRAMDNMINISGEYGLDIYDRNYDNPTSPNRFPEEFKQYIVGTLKGDQIDLAYKGYKVSLNVNSIIDSPTMFSRRVFELLAANTPVVSSESLGIKTMLGDLVVASSDYQELQMRIRLLFEDEYFYKKVRLHALREVLSHHTYHNRVRDMLDYMSFSYKKEELQVTVIGVVKSHKDYEELMEQFHRQQFQNKKLVILLDIFEGYLKIFNTNNNDMVKTYLIDYIHHYESINDIIETEYYAPFHLQNYYGEHYLTDMMLATSYTEKTIIVKKQGPEYTYVTNGNMDQSLLYKEASKLLSPLEFVNQLTSRSQRSLDNLFKYGFRFFNIDDFNVIGNYKSRKGIDNFIRKINI